MSPLQILIADDHLLFSQAIADQLYARHPGCGCTLVTSFDELKRAEVGKFSLIIVDLGLSDGDALPWLETKPAVKMLVLSSAFEEAIINKVLALEIDGFVHKSDDTQCLHLAIETIMGGGRYLSPRVQALHQAIKRKPDALHKILSPREYEVLQLVGRGLSGNEIARLLGLRASSVSDHKKNLMAKLSVSSVQELMRCAIERGLNRV